MQKDQIRSTVGIPQELVRELLSALCSSAGKYLATVSVGHSLTETVLHLSVALLRLVSSLHLSDLRFNNKNSVGKPTFK